MESQKHITGVILAGGKGTRIGGEKGFVLYKGKPFIVHIIDVLKPLVGEIIIVTNNSNYKQFKQICVSDIIKNAGPMAGLHSGLYHSKTKTNLVLSCDVPLVNDVILTKLIKEISEENDVVQIMSHGKTNPLIAVYKKRCLSACLKSLESGERRLHTFIDQLNTKTITVEQSLEKYTQNINTQNELKLLENDTEH